MNNMMDGAMAGGWVMGGIGIPLIVVPLLATAALIEHLVFSGPRND